MIKHAYHTTKHDIITLTWLLQQWMNPGVWLLSILSLALLCCPPVYNCLPKILWQYCTQVRYSHAGAEVQ